ncbi:NapC/NirT family cytochrome c [Shigella flexneri]
MAAGYCWRKKPYIKRRISILPSCHWMSKPFEEYRELSAFRTRKGYVRMCHCHIPKSGMDYLFAKLKASKDIYHEFVSGKIDSDDTFETHTPGNGQNSMERI